MKKRRLKKWVKVVIVLLFMVTQGSFIMLTAKLLGPSEVTARNSYTDFSRSAVNIEIVEPEVETPKIETTEPVVEVVEPVVEVPVVVESTTTTLDYRLTSYYPGDDTNSTHQTGSGKTTGDFQVNSKGWYTYEGKLVLAGATTACLNTTRDQACMKYGYVEGRHYFNYYDIVTIVIDGVSYEGIILDSCGASMGVSENRVDLYVSSKSSAIDRGYRGQNMTQLTFNK